MIFIVEPDSTGHRLVYVQLLVAGALERGHKVTLLLGRSAKESQELQTHLASYLDHGDVAVCWGSSWFDILTCIKTVGRPSLIVIPHLDRFLAKTFELVALARVAKVPGLVMQHPRWEPKSSVGLLRRLKLLVKATAIAFLRFAGVDAKELSGPNSVAPRSVPDPVLVGDLKTTRNRAGEIRVANGMDSQRYWIGVVGGITDRKNVSILLEAIVALPPAERRAFGLALLGQYRCSAQSLAEVRERCAAAGIALAVHDHLMTNDEVNASIAALDCVATLYSTHTPNSTVAKAAALDISILAAGSTSYQYHVKQTAGVPTFALTIAAVSDGLLKAVAGDLRPSSCPPVGSEIFVEQMLNVA